MHIIFQKKVLLRTSSCREWVVNIKFLTKYSWTLPHCGPSLFYHGMFLVFLFLSENVPAIIPAMLMKWVNLNHMIKIRFFSSHHFLLFLFFFKLYFRLPKFFLSFLPNSFTSHHPLFKFIFWLLDSFPCRTERLPILSQHLWLSRWATQSIQLLQMKSDCYCDHAYI